MAIKKHPWTGAFGICFVVVIADLMIKLALTGQVVDYPFSKNYDALFGFPFQNRLAIILLFILASLTAYYWKKKLSSSDSYTKISIGLAAGGISGNILDRILHGFIIDYINFPGLFSFNISDLAIFTGISLFFLKIIKK